MKRSISVALVAVLYLPLASANTLFHSAQFRGYFDSGLAFGQGAQGALDAGAGKLRFGQGSGASYIRANISEAHLIGSISAGSTVKGLVDIKFDDEQRHALDIAELHLTWRTPTSETGRRWRFRVGSFLPPFSLENHAIAWSSPYTLSSSSLNTWIGEEVRINGIDVQLSQRYGSWDFQIQGATYLGNDAAGTLLGFRGFAIHDRELALFDSERIPRFQALLNLPPSPFADQSPRFEPLHEIDGRLGYYLGAGVERNKKHRIVAYYYDNRGDPDALNRTAGQYAWRTRFVVIGLRSQLAGRVRWISQVMVGETIMGPKFPNGGPHAFDTGFLSAYSMLHKRFGKLGLTLKGEYFETSDNDLMKGPADSTEHGYALTGALTYRMTPRLKLYLESQYTEHDRPVRAFSRFEKQIDEWLIRANLRVFF
ncbi:MAG: hypothetical protein AAF384_09380 [Pseudomonadota bacterium]